MEAVIGFPQLETDRLILQEMKLGNVDFYFCHFNNDKIIQGSCFPGPESLKAAKEELKRYCVMPFKENRSIRWGIARKGDEELIGTCGHYDWNKTARRAEIGYNLDSTHSGQGIMTEALRAMLEYGFEDGFEQNSSNYRLENAGSVRLFQRLGFKKEGILRQNSHFCGFRDDVVFSLLRQEWART